MDASYKILNKPQLRKRPMRESVPFSFQAFLQDIITEDRKVFKMTTGTIKITGWTRHYHDCDIDTVIMEIHGRMVDIKAQLEYLGGMKKIDEAAKNYVRRNYYNNLKAV